MDYATMTLPELAARLSELNDSISALKQEQKELTAEYKACLAALIHAAGGNEE